MSSQKTDIYDRLDAAAAIRKELLQAQTLQSSSIKGSSRVDDPKGRDEERERERRRDLLRDREKEREREKGTIKRKTTGKGTYPTQVVIWWVGFIRGALSVALAFKHEIIIFLTPFVRVEDRAVATLGVKPS
ncbi:hypothetical protein Tco_1112887 [Tanacetum coccineum]|uniref:Uncharacterized protein n=1 Tax=Tanacetum coccineum TaxID=301880 RepID=A0ABQ5IUA3_9ASTR